MYWEPLIDHTVLSQPQIPVTLPTYDEVIGQHGVTDCNYNTSLISHLKPNGLNVLAIHAEVEGIACLPLFEAFIQQARKLGYQFEPLGNLLKAKTHLPVFRIASHEMQGREGMVAFQGKEL